MRVLARKPEARLLVDPARRVEAALRPQRDPAIACLPRESDAFGDEPPPDPESARMISTSSGGFGSFVSIAEANG